MIYGAGSRGIVVDVGNGFEDLNGHLEPWSVKARDVAPVPAACGLAQRDDGTGRRYLERRVEDGGRGRRRRRRRRCKASSEREVV